MAQQFQRKKFIIGAEFQTKYMGIMLSNVLITGLVFGLGVYFTMVKVINDKLPSVEGQMLVSDVVLSEVNRYLLLALPVVVLVVVIISIFISHKIAGPEYRLSRVLDGVAKGDFTGSTKLRDKDELQTLAKKMSIANHNLSSMISRQKNMIRVLVREFNALKKATGPDKSKAKKLAVLTESIAKKAGALDAEFKNYKTL